jgi:hypothetical protein
MLPIDHTVRQLLVEPQLEALGSDLCNEFGWGAKDRLVGESRSGAVAGLVNKGLLITALVLLRARMGRESRSRTHPIAQQYGF